MNHVKRINIKKRWYHFSDDMISVRNFDPSKIKIDHNSYKNVLIYYIKYIATNSVKVFVPCY